MAAEDRKFSLWVLAWPIFIELFLAFLLGAADTVMVSRISDNAVAVVGFSNQLFNALTTLFMVVASGAGILISQKLGARKEEDARTISVMAVKVTALIGLCLSLLLTFQPLLLVRMLSLPKELYGLAETYISIVGGGMVLVAVMATLATVIRNTGNTRGPMFVAVGINVLHVILNYGFIFGELGLPQLGLQGVAISTTLVRGVGVILLLGMYIQAFERRIEWKDLGLFDRSLFKEVLKIGWPLGINMACWVFSQLVIFSFIAQLGEKELAARTYMNTMESFCFLLGWSVAMAAQIKIAHLFGAGRTREAYRSAFQATGVGLILVMFNALLLVSLGDQALGIFTKDEEILAMGMTLLWFNLILQPGKMVNMALGNALNAVGDTRFNMIISLGSMWLIAVLLSYWLGIHLQWGLIAIYIGMISDEYVRGAISLWRWRGQAHLRKAEKEQLDQVSRSDKIGNVSLEY